MSIGWFRSSITGTDNKTVEGAYVALAFIMGLAGISILSLIGLAYVDVLVNEKEFNPAGLGGGISAVLGGLAAFLGGVGAFILMDRKQPSAAGMVTETRTETQHTTTMAPVEPVATNGDTKQLSPTIGQADVGKAVTLEPPKKARIKGRK